MFEKDEVLRELHARLTAAGIDPLDPKVQAICTDRQRVLRGEDPRGSAADAGRSQQNRDVSLRRRQAAAPRSHNA